MVNVSPIGSAFAEKCLAVGSQRIMLSCPLRNPRLTPTAHLGVDRRMASQAAKYSVVCGGRAALLSAEQDPASDLEEPEMHRTSCYCRVCQADLELLGRLKGTETHAMQSLAQNIVFRMLSIFTEVAAVGYSELLSQLRKAWLTPKLLSRPIRDLFIGRARLTSLECGVLEAFVIEELHKRKHTSGIPPPVAEQLSNSELNHVA